MILLCRYNDHDIAPKEIEHILETHPAVKECLVFGMPNDEFMNLISAVVCLKEDNYATVEELREWVSHRVEMEFQQIRGPILFWAKVPRSSRGKVLRREVTKWARDGHNKQRTHIMFQEKATNTVEDHTQSR